MAIWRKIGWVAHKLAIFVGIAAMIGVGVYIGRPPEKTGNQPDFTGAEQQKKRLAVFLDGTWNSIETNTNVWRMRALCASKGRDGKPQLIYYGLGVNGFIGGAFGQGIDENIRSAYEWLVENYNDGDEIFIFGFSRGAYTARALAGLIAIDGILKAGSPIGVSELFDRYKRGDGEETIWTLKDMEAAHSEKITDQERLLLKYSQLAYVTVVGVWDTVGSIGIEAGDFTGVSSSQFDYLQTGLRLPILNAYHALAIDEHRKKFSPTLWDVHRKDPTDIVRPPARALTSVEQRWFVGAHANVGGGYPTDLLPQPSLLWLMKKAEAHGLTFRTEVILDGNLLSYPVVDSYGSFLLGIYKLYEGVHYRTIGEAPQVRDDGAHINVNETIDVSVFDRWRKDSSYRPKNLVEWSQRKKVDPVSLQVSVRADDPSVQVPDQ